MVYEYWFSRIKGISSGKKRKLREYFKDAASIYNIEGTENIYPDFINEKEDRILLNAKKEKDLEQQYRQLEKSGIKFIPWHSLQYPKKLKNIPAPPYALYVKGNLPSEHLISVAIVGARSCTPYGETMALQYGQELARYGVQIISGMARGIDGFAQRGALNVGGKTYGVLGCGADVCYPKEHQGLYEDMLREGGIVSEYLPGTPPLPANFPARNRIISGLSDVVLVMEAKEKSGSLITADMALEQGKDVYALPGPVTSALSKGCHYLISQGAGILISPDELRKELKIPDRKEEQNSDKNEKELERPENIVYSCLDLYPKGIQAIVDETGLSSRQIIKDLISLELEGKVKEISKNHYVRTTR